MGLLDALEPPKKERSCKIRSVKAELDKKDQEILDRALADVELWPAKTLSNQLQNRGLIITDTTITRHRKGLCSC